MFAVQIEVVLFQVKRIDQQYGTTSTLRTSTNWVIAVTSGHLADLNGVSVPLDNVIILTPFRVHLVRQNTSVLHGDVYTLMWRHGGRSLDHVMRLVDDASTLTNNSQPRPSTQEPNCWPNRQFGLNGRTVVIVTKEVPASQSTNQRQKPVYWRMARQF